jgi:demethylmenaquinone methyltransferase/2-methoxy-6-polyprenyl-1,4-benzoquinol methylase
MRDGLDTKRIETIYNHIAKRYDFQHALITARSDGRGRKLVVENTVRPDDHVLDCGAGTGITAFLAAQKVGPDGHVTLFDLSEGMLAVAKEKARALGLQDQVTFHTGDMLHLAFEDGYFDAVLSTYSLCPLYDPAKGALELFRVLKAGGRGGVAHSTEPSTPLMRWLANRVEDLAWKFPAVSMGCRAVSVLPALKQAGATVIFHRLIGVPLWPFEVFVVEKPK